MGFRRKVIEMKEEFYSLKRDVLNKKLTNMTMLDEKRGIITLEFGLPFAMIVLKS
jgi:hypothetical protein